MCQLLEVTDYLGYKYTKVNFDNTSYAWDSCINKKPLRILFYSKNQTAIINGIELYLLEYISMALNTSIQFVRMVYQKLNPETGLYHDSNADLIASAKFTWPPTHPISGVVRPIWSPFFECHTYGFLSLNHPVALSFSKTTRIFDLWVSSSLYLN